MSGARKRRRSVWIAGDLAREMVDAVSWINRPGKPGGFSADLLVQCSIRHLLATARDLPEAKKCPPRDVGHRSDPCKVAKVQLKIPISDRVWFLLKSLAYHRGQSVSHLLGEAVDEYLDELTRDLVLPVPIPSEV